VAGRRGVGAPVADLSRLLRQRPLVHTTRAMPRDPRRRRRSALVASRRFRTGTFLQRRSCMQVLGRATDRRSGSTPEVRRRMRSRRCRPPGTCRERGGNPRSNPDRSHDRRSSRPLRHERPRSRRRHRRPTCRLAAGCSRWSSSRATGRVTRSATSHRKSTPRDLAVTPRAPRARGAARSARRASSGR